MKFLRLALLLALLAGAAVAFWVYPMAIKSNVKQGGYADIPTGADFEMAMSRIRPYLTDEDAFRQWAEQRGYAKAVKPGHYRLKRGMSNRELVNMLRSGNQEPVKVIFNNVRLPQDLASKATRALEMDSFKLLKALNDPANWQKYGFKQETFMSMFLPNTYEMFWNVSPEKFLDKMKKEYDKFWTDERKAKAKALGMTPEEVSTLASVVQSETIKDDDAPIIAGVYVNRLKKGIPLQADPTLVFALKDFTLKRVLDVHKEVESPYNTYKYAGLPPGPICLPTIENLEATLNPTQHDYIYFCAKEDFSGYSNFAVTYEQHLVNARRYQEALNKRNIR